MKRKDIINPDVNVDYLHSIQPISMFDGAPVDAPPPADAPANNEQTPPADTNESQESEQTTSSTEQVSESDTASSDSSQDSESTDEDMSVADSSASDENDREELEDKLSHGESDQNDNTHDSESQTTQESENTEQSTTNLSDEESEEPLLDQEQEEQTTNEIVIIDESVEDASTLINDVLESGREVYILNYLPQLNGVDQITAILNSQDKPVDAIHLITHGSENGISITGTMVNAENIDDYNFEQWSKSLSEGADLLLYGCDIAKNENGIDLVNEIADRTGADVSASDDITASELNNGDWDLEVKIGNISTNVVISENARQSYKGNLALIEEVGKTTKELKKLDHYYKVYSQNDPKLNTVEEMRILASKEVESGRLGFLADPDFGKTEIDHLQKQANKLIDFDYMVIGLNDLVYDGLIQMEHNSYQGGEAILFGYGKEIEVKSTRDIFGNGPVLPADKADFKALPWAPGYPNNIDKDADYVAIATKDNPSLGVTKGQWFMVPNEPLSGAKVAYAFEWDEGGGRSQHGSVSEFFKPGETKTINVDQFGFSQGPDKLEFKKFNPTYLANLKGEFDEASDFDPISGELTYTAPTQPDPLGLDIIRLAYWDPDTGKGDEFSVFLFIGLPPEAQLHGPDDITHKQGDGPIALTPNLENIDPDSINFTKGVIKVENYNPLTDIITLPDISTDNITVKRVETADTLEFHLSGEDSPIDYQAQERLLSIDFVGDVDGVPRIITLVNTDDTADRTSDPTVLSFDSNILTMQVTPIGPPTINPGEPAIPVDPDEPIDPTNPPKECYNIMVIDGRPSAVFQDDFSIIDGSSVNLNSATITLNMQPSDIVYFDENQNGSAQSSEVISDGSTYQLNNISITVSVNNGVYNAILTGVDTKENYEKAHKAFFVKFPSGSGLADRFASAQVVDDTNLTSDLIEVALCAKPKPATPEVTVEKPAITSEPVIEDIFQEQAIANRHVNQEEEEERFIAEFGKSEMKESVHIFINALVNGHDHILESQYDVNYLNDQIIQNNLKDAQLIVNEINETTNSLSKEGINVETLVAELNNIDDHQVYSEINDLMRVEHALSK